MSTNRAAAPVLRVVSGGQSGVDRAALDAALELGLPCGGWCPRGRRAEDGPIAPHYPLRETPEASYEQRTEWNVRDSDATLILTSDEIGGGTALTVRVARRLGRPLLVADPLAADAADEIRAWLRTANVRTLNVAGPRESGAPGVYRAARALLRAVLGAPG